MATPPPQGSYAAYGTPQPGSGFPADKEGVTHLRIASLLGMITQLLFWIGTAIFYLIFTGIQNSTTSITGTSTSIPSWITPGTVYAAIGLMAGGLVIGIIVFVFFYLGFRAIKRGSSDFGAPTTLMLIGLIGFLLVVVGLVVIIGTFISAVNSASSGSASIDLGALLGGIAAIGFGALLSLIGVIGLVLGNWRAGKRYDESTIRIGAILSILPYLSIVGYILLFVGYMHAGSKLNSGFIPGGMGQMPPPGYYAPPPGGPSPPWQAPPPPPPQG